MKYFDKSTQMVPINPETIPEQTLYHARQAFDWDNNQNPSISFALYWLGLVKESYRQAQRVHPKSSIKRKSYLERIFPYGHSLYRNPSRFLRWYLQRTGGTLIGDPTGKYFVPINTLDTQLESVPNPQPNTLADNFTLTLLRYYLKPPAVRYTRKETGYGFIKMTVPPYVTLSKEPRFEWKKDKATQVSGYLDEDVIREFIRGEIGIYIRQFESSMDPTYVRFLKQTTLIAF